MTDIATQLEDAAKSLARGDDASMDLIMNAVRALRAGAADTARLDHIANEYLQVEPFDMPTGQGDADVGWRLSNFVQGKEGPQPLHLEFQDDLRAAIDADRAAKLVTNKETHQW